MEVQTRGTATRRTPAPVVLRGYQATILGKVSRQWRAGRKRVLVSSPCGSGKTEISIAMAERTHANAKRCLFVCDRVAIIQQTIKRFVRAGLPVGVLWRDLTRNPTAPVLIASSQTIKSRGIESIGDRLLVVIDEAHIDRQVSFEIVKQVVEAGGFAIGLTGTPIGPAVAGRWDAMVAGPTSCELARDGYAIVPELIQRWSPEEHEFEHVGTGPGDEYDAGEAGELMSRFAAWIAGDVIRWLEERRLPGMPPTILFGATKEHARGQLEALRRRGISCAEIFDDTHTRDRVAALRAFEAGRIRVLGSVSALSVGFDSPKAVLMLNLRPLRRAVAEFMQSAGRVARVAEGKTDAYVLDYTGTVDRMGRYTRERWETGWKSLPTAAPKRRKRRWTCECGCENAATNRVCEACGRPRPAGGGSFPLPECRRCNPPAVQRPGATVCRQCHHPIPGKTIMCPIHGIPLSELRRKTQEGEEPQIVYYCAHPGCEFCSEAELAVRQQEAFGTGQPLLRGSYKKDTPGQAWIRIPDECNDAGTLVGKHVWIRNRPHRIRQMVGGIFTARSGDRIARARVSEPQREESSLAEAATA